MKRSIPLTALLATLAAAPLAAQGTVGIAHFLTVSDENVPQLEEGLKRHLRFHEAQNDTWVWNIYQALGGGLEYVGSHLTRTPCCSRSFLATFQKFKSSISANGPLSSMICFVIHR